MINDKLSLKHLKMLVYELQTVDLFGFIEKFETSFRLYSGPKS